MPLKILSLARRPLSLNRLPRGQTPALLGAAICLVASSASAQVFETVGTRALGMAGAFVAVADDATAVYWNPAGLGTAATFDLQLGREAREALGDRGRPQDPAGRVSRGSTRLVAMAVPSLGLAYYRVRATAARADAMTTVTTAGDRKTDRWGDLRLDSLTTQNFGVSLVQSVDNGLVLGTTLRLVRGTAAIGSVPGSGPGEEALDAADQLTGRTSAAFDLDAGAMASLGVVRVGIVARNLRQPEFALQPGEAKARLKRQVRLGMAVAPRSRPAGVHGPFTVSVDVDLTRNAGPAGEHRHVAAGIERWWAGGRLGTRAGVRVETLGRRTPVLAAGLSLGVRSSTFIEGQLTRGRETSEKSWGIATRATF